MKRKIIVSSFILFGLLSKLFAQQATDEVKKKTEKKVTVKKKKGKDSNSTTTVTVNGSEVDLEDDNLDMDPSEIKTIKRTNRTTIVVDGDNVTINGKPVDKLSDNEIKILKGHSQHLGHVAPYINMRMNRRRGSTNWQNDDIMPPIGHDENFEVFMNEDEQMPANKALLGVTTEKDEKGAKITVVSKESGAEKAGLLKGDIITKINDYAIANSDDLVAAIGKHEPDQKVTVTYIRDGKTKTAEATLTKNNTKNVKVFSWGGNNNEPFNMNELKMDGFNFDRENIHFGKTRPKIGFKVQDMEEGAGFKVLDVEPETPAAKAGIKVGDVITHFEDVELKDVKDFDSRTALHKPGNSLKITYKRDGISNQTEIKFPKKLTTADL